MMKFKFLLMVVICTQVLVLSIYISSVGKDESYYKKKYEEQLIINDSLTLEINNWNDHCERMKRILGIEKEGNITWVDKVSHPIDTKRLTK